MSKKKSSNSAFQALRDMWYKKLKDEGFEDAEAGPYLKEWHSFYFQARHEPSSFLIKQNYFYRANHFLLTHDFDSYLDKSIWELHAKGISVRDIATALKDTHTPNCEKGECHVFCPHFLSKTTPTAINKDSVSQAIVRLRFIFLKYFHKEHDE